MTSFFNDNFLSVVKKAVEEIRKQGKQEFTTINLILKYWGHYHNDTCPASDSINAHIGRFLKERSGDLGIKEIEPDRPGKDEEGKPTSCSLWQLV
jgi:hypothetical protein